MLSYTIFSHFNYFSTLNFPLSFVLEASVSGLWFCFCFYLERESKIENEKMKELKELQAEENHKKESLQ